MVSAHFVAPFLTSPAFTLWAGLFALCSLIFSALRIFFKV